MLEIWEFVGPPIPNIPSGCIMLNRIVYGRDSPYLYYTMWSRQHIQRLQDMEQTLGIKQIPGEHDQQQQVWKEQACRKW